MIQTEKQKAGGPLLQRNELLIIGGAIAITIISGILVLLQSAPVLIFIVAGLALSLLAAVVGQATEQLGARMGSGATGVLQSALGNLPELFVSIFALRAGLLEVVQATIVGSILGNSLFVLGLAFMVGGAKFGKQKFASQAPRTIATLTFLSVAALAIPTMVHGLHTPAAGHEQVLSIACSIILLLIFLASLPVSLSDSGGAGTTGEKEENGKAWPLWLAIVILSIAGIGSAFVSDWFVTALTPAINILHLSQAFTGLVIVALAGNAVENVVGIQFAARNQQDFALSVILNSSLQVALCLTPILVLLSFVVSSTHLTLVMPPLLVGELGLAALISAVIIIDGESTWLEGLVLIGLYGIMAASFWWG